MKYGNYLAFRQGNRFQTLAKAVGRRENLFVAGKFQTLSKRLNIRFRQVQLSFISLLLHCCLIKFILNKI
jgi:hypothetical protein